MYLRWKVLLPLKPSLYGFRGGQIDRKVYKSRRLNRYPKRKPFFNVFNSDGLCLYNGSYWDCRAYVEFSYELGLRIVQPEHEFSSRSKSNLRRKIYAFTTVATRFYFHTLTFVAPVDEKKAQNCLNRYLTIMRKDYGFNYIWVAEYQKSGRPHFHIICDRFYDVKELNRLWLKAQLTGGVVAPFHYKKNPYDIRKNPIYDPLHIFNYFNHYLKKSSYSGLHRKWGCSRFISNLFTDMPLDSSAARHMASQGKRYEIDNHGYKYTMYIVRYTKQLIKPLIILNHYVKEFYKRKDFCRNIAQAIYSNINSFHSVNVNNFTRDFNIRNAFFRIFGIDNGSDLLRV